MYLKSDENKGVCVWAVSDNRNAFSKKKKEVEHFINS